MILNYYKVFSQEEIKSGEATGIARKEGKEDTCNNQLDWQCTLFRNINGRFCSGNAHCSAESEDNNGPIPCNNEQKQSCVNFINNGGIICSYTNPSGERLCN